MFSEEFIEKLCTVLKAIDIECMEDMASGLHHIRRSKGRLFVVGTGGNSANASHAVNDFRKLDSIEAYSITDNVPELTARVNDESWEKAYAGILKESNLKKGDGLFILSVGGGSLKEKISENLIHAADYSAARGATIFCIAGRDGGDVMRYCDYSILIPPLYPEMVTPLTEAAISSVLHLLVTHPTLARNPAKWQN